MTHSGGKPHAVGDKGQRYEVRYRDPDTGQRKVFGWSNDLEGARAMMEAIDLHPSMDAPSVADRWLCPVCGANKHEGEACTDYPHPEVRQGTS